MKQRKQLTKKEAIQRGYYVAIPLFLLNAFGFPLLEGYPIELNRVVINIIVWSAFGYLMGLLTHYLHKRDMR